MTCAELRERLVDPGSAALGGHAPVVDHLEACSDCRAAMRSFAAIDRLFRPATLVEPPPDFDQRVKERMTRPGPGPRAFFGSPALAVRAGWVAFTVVLIAGVLLLWRSPGSSPSGGASATASRSRRAAEEPPDIVAVRSTPLTLERPLAESEKAQALAIDDIDFLNWSETLAGLDALFAERIGPREERALSSPALQAAGPPSTPEDAANRLLDWRRMPKSERERLVALDGAFRQRAEAHRFLLAERWAALSKLSEQDKAGLKRLASRLGDLEGRQLARLEADIRTIAALPAADRPARWRQLPFAQRLTGQEVEIGEKLLVAR